MIDKSPRDLEGLLTRHARVIKRMGTFGRIIIDRRVGEIPSRRADKRQIQGQIAIILEVAPLEKVGIQSSILHREGDGFLSTPLD